MIRFEFSFFAAESPKKLLKYLEAKKGSQKSLPSIEKYFLHLTCEKKLNEQEKIVAGTISQWKLIYHTLPKVIILLMMASIFLMGYNLGNIPDFDLKLFGQLALLILYIISSIILVLFLLDFCSGSFSYEKIVSVRSKNNSVRKIFLAGFFISFIALCIFSELMCECTLFSRGKKVTETYKRYWTSFFIVLINSLFFSLATYINMKSSKHTAAVEVDVFHMFDTVRTDSDLEIAKFCF